MSQRIGGSAFAVKNKAKSCLISILIFLILIDFLSLLGLWQIISNNFDWSNSRAKILHRMEREMTRGGVAERTARNLYTRATLTG